MLMSSKFGDASIIMQIFGAKSVKLHFFAKNDYQ